MMFSQTLPFSHVMSMRSCDEWAWLAHGQLIIPSPKDLNAMIAKMTEDHSESVERMRRWPEKIQNGVLMIGSTAASWQSGMSGGTNQTTWDPDQHSGASTKPSIPALTKFFQDGWKSDVNAQGGFQVLLKVVVFDMPNSYKYFWSILKFCKMFLSISIFSRISVGKVHKNRQISGETLEVCSDKRKPRENRQTDGQTGRHTDGRLDWQRDGRTDGVLDV